MAARVRLYGQVRWAVGDREVAVRGQTRTDVLVMLVEAAGSIVSVDAILERLWDKRPGSGDNAVQRHISGLRAELRELGGGDSHTLIERLGNGYRLGPGITSDLDHLPNSPSSDDVHWWLEPLVGASWDRHRPFHAQLASLALLQARSLIKPASFDLREVRDRFVPLLRHSPAREELMDLCIERALTLAPGSDAATLAEIASTSLRLDDDPQVHRKLGRIGLDSASGLIAGLGPEAIKLVKRCLGLWQAGRPREALDALDAASGTVGDDLERRLYRWLVWMPDDPWVSHGFSLITRSSISPDRGDERMVCSADARCLMQIPDGVQIADSEIAAARTARVGDLVRALRVRHMLGLSRPHDDAQDTIIEELGSITSSRDAMVEAARFRFLSALRRCDYDDCEPLLNALEATVSLHWAGSGDDFAVMARDSLGRSADCELRKRFDGDSLGHVRYLADAFVVETAETCGALLDAERAASVQDTALYSVVGISSSGCGTAMRLLRDLHRGERVEELAHAIAMRLPATVREMQFLMLPVALTIVAERTRNREIAAAAATALTPWAGQTLGLWPVDFIIGPCDEWLDRLASV